MEENKLKQKIQQKVKEKIAISNWKEEMNRNQRKNVKIVYGILASCAMFALCAGVMIDKTQLKQSDNSVLQAKLEDLKEELKTEIYINKTNGLKGDYFLDAQTRKMDAKAIAVDLRFKIDVIIPSDFEKNFEVNGIYIKGNDLKKYDVLQQYDFYYGNKEQTRTITLSLGFKDKRPVRDYYFLNVEKTSRIGEVELEITQYKDSYLVIFSYKDVNYDIETTGITQDELIEFLTSLISNAKSYEQMVAKDQEDNTKEQTKSNSDSIYPTYYAGKYVDDQGNNVILLKEDTKENRKAICQLLNITESKTKFEMAKYSYEYLTELQKKISEKMRNKELPFVISSSIREEKNWIEIEVTTNKESELEKIRQLDTIGGAFSIRYSKNGSAKTDMLKEKE